MTGSSNGAEGTVPPAGKGKRKGWYARNDRRIAQYLTGFVLMLAEVCFVVGLTLGAMHWLADTGSNVWEPLVKGIGAFVVLMLVHRAVTGQWHDDRRSYDPPSEWSPAARPGGDGSPWRRAVARVPVQWLDRLGSTIGLVGLLVWLDHPRMGFEFDRWLPLAIGLGTFAATHVIGYLVIHTRYHEGRS